MKRDDSKNNTNDNSIDNTASSKCSSYNQSGGQPSSSNNTSDNSKPNKPTQSKLCCFGYVDYIVLASTLSVALGEELSIQDINILSTFFAVLSDELALIGTVKNCPTAQTSQTFVPPVPDVAVTANNSNLKKSPKPHRKKVIRKKIKKSKKN